MDDFVISGTREPWGGTSGIPTGAGLCAIYLTNKESLPEDWRDWLWREDGLLYIGESGDLERRLREHFEGPTSKSTFRRSIDAVLCGHLSVKRQLKPSSAGKYDLEDEQVLSNWIQQNCEFSYESGEESKNAAKGCIGRFYPPLNLRSNPKSPRALKDKLKAARDECVGMASL